MHGTWAGGKSPTWRPGELPTGGFPAPPWAHLVRRPEGWPRPLRLALPCVGLDGCGHALRGLGVPFEVAYAYDVCGYLRAPLESLHGRAARSFRLGPVEGDLLRADIGAWERVDAVVAGPPCPPFSRCGRRGDLADPRARVWERCTDVLVDQGRKGCLFFIYEMVPGFQDRRQILPGAPDQDPRSVSERWLAELAARAPMWRVAQWHLNTRDYLPQERRRVYTVGVNQQALGAVFPMPPAPPRGGRIGLEDILNWDLPLRTDALLDAGAWDRLAVYTAGDPGAAGGLLALELDRDPQRVWNGGRGVGHLPTLRTGNDFIWIVGTATPGQISRGLHALERLAAQGFPPEVGRGLTKSQVLAATGNAFSVPVVAAALARCLEAVGRAFAAGLVPWPLAAPGCAEQLARHRRLQRLAAETADDTAATRRLGLQTRRAGAAAAAGPPGRDA